MTTKDVRAAFHGGLIDQMTFISVHCPWSELRWNKLFNGWFLKLALDDKKYSGHGSTPQEAFRDALRELVKFR